MKKVLAIYTEYDTVHQQQIKKGWGDVTNKFQFDPFEPHDRIAV